MSGQPTRNPMDASKYRQQYLANLNLRANLDDMNLQANKIYKKTGQTPSQPTDSRTTAEKLGDIERLKIDLRSQLSQIADGQQAQAIVENLGDVELQFLAQHIDEIVKEIKPKYKLGVLADIFVPYLQKYMDKANLTNEVNFGLQQSKGDDILLSVQQILGDMINPQMLNQLKQDLDQSSDRMRVSLITEIKRDIQFLERVIPSRDFLANINTIQDAITKATIYEALSSALGNLPTNSELLPLLRKLQTANQLGDKREVDAVGVKIAELLGTDDATNKELQFVIQQVSQELQTQSSIAGTYPKTRTGLTQDEIDELRGTFTPLEDLSPKTKARYVKYINDMKKIYNSTSRQNITNGTDLKVKSINDKTNVEDLQKAVNNLNAIVAPLIFSGAIQYSGKGNPTPLEPDISMMGKGIKGCGFAKPKKYYPTKPIYDEIDYSAGIMPKNKYAPFGKYFIDSHRLNDNVVSVRRANGVNISGLPVKLVSKDLGEVIRTILGGGLPQYHHLDRLEDEEKLYLHKLAKTTHLLDRLSIPTPNKGEDEKSINQFEIMKGEILNGNDSVDLVKKFKLLIVKLVSKDLLPKGQAKEILMELATLGY